MWERLGETRENNNLHSRAVADRLAGCRGPKYRGVHLQIYLHSLPWPERGWQGPRGIDDHAGGLAFGRGAKKTDEQLYNGIAVGVGHKQYTHAFAERGMGSEQITDVVSYIRGFAEKSKKFD